MPPLTQLLHVGTEVHRGNCISVAFKMPLQRWVLLIVVTQQLDYSDSISFLLPPQLRVCMPLWGSSHTCLCLCIFIWFLRKLTLRKDSRVISSLGR